MKIRNILTKSPAVSLLTVLAGIAMIVLFSMEITASGKPTEIVPAKERMITSLQDINKALTDIAAEAKPAVVTVSTERTLSMPQGSLDFDYFFHYFMNPNQPPPQGNREYHQYGLGSGVIIDGDGRILTNAHVVDDADSIFVRTSDEHKYAAQVIGIDKKTDIAVLQIDEDGMPYLQAANSDSLRVGEIVLAIGSPMSENLAYTVTQGIVSATGRSNVGLADYEDFIQTDAAINPGNSGGPLINLDGKLVGINTAIISQSGGFQGIGFAVPVNMAMHVMHSLITEGKVVRGWLGVSIQDINESIAHAMNIKQTAGALVGDVLPDSPASKAGIKAGDIIVGVGQSEIHKAADIRNRIAASSPGTAVKIALIRNGERQTVTVTLGDASDHQMQAAGTEGMLQRLGFAVKDLTPDIRRQYGISSDVAGVVVAAIDQNSNAYRAGLREGDVVSAVNQAATENTGAFMKQVSGLNDGDSLLLRVYRDGSGFFLAFSL